MRPRVVTGRLLTAALIAGLVGALAATGAVWTVHSLRPAPGDLHDLLHERIPLNQAERARLDVKEKVFIARRAAIEERMKAANGHLAAAIQTDPRWSAQVEAATREVETAAADLQRTTLEHVFEMREGLDPEHRKTYEQALIAALQRGAR